MLAVMKAGNVAASVRDAHYPMTGCQDTLLVPLRALSMNSEALASTNILVNTHLSFYLLIQLVRVDVEWLFRV